MRRSFKLTALLCCALCVSSAYAWKTVTLTKVNSLGALAEKYRPVDVKQMDMVIAIRSANPKIFSSLANFKPGASLLIPTNAAEVRLAIKGKYPAPASASAATATSAIVVSTTAVPVSQTPSIATANSKVSAVATTPATSSHAVKTLTTENSNVANKKVVTISKSVAVQTNVAVATKKANAPVAIVSATSNSLSASSSSKDLVVDKMPSSASSTSLDVVAGSTLKSLQATIASQTQAIQSYQAQITDLNNQLGAANQQMQSMEVNAQRLPIWSVSNLGWALWALTLLVFLQQVRKNKKLARAVYAQMSEESSENEHEELEYEPNFKETNVKEDLEPQVAKSKSDRATSESNWEQVELDIPVSEPDVQDATLNSESEGLGSVAAEVFDDQALAGEQQDIISALEKEQDNLDWHRALLEFYIKTNSHNGFKRHYQMMMQTGLMREGDSLWEEVRKMYLNSWIYPGFSS